MITELVYYGYTASYTADGKLSIVFKDAPDKLSDAIVALDAGHGGKDCGTIGVNGIYESEVNLNITILVKEKLENAGKQFDSETMTRYNASRDYIALYLAREQ